MKTNGIGAVIGSLCLLLHLSASADVIVSTFTGGDVGEGFELSGTYDYTVNLGNSAGSLSIQGYNFVDVTTAGITLTANFLNPWATAPVYGITANDTALASMMHNTALDFDDAPFIVMSVPVTSGTEYTLRLLFSENSTTQPNRRQDIIVEGLTILDDFQITQGNGVSNPQTYGTIVTYTFTAADDILNIELARGAGGADPNPIAQGFTLQVVPEPSVLSIMAMGVLALVFRRNNRPM
jgi:hypothetical protein